MRGNGVWGNPAPFEVGKLVVLSHDLQGFIYIIYIYIFQVVWDFFHEWYDSCYYLSTKKRR